MITDNKEYIVFGSPLIGEEEINEVVDTLKSGWLGTGPKVTKFETMVSQFVGARFGLALNSCTAGLHLSLLACGIKEGDEVITTPLTFCATANAIIHSGARPVFVDINKETMNIDENLLEAAITRNTKAIMPVHLAGRPCNMDAIMEIAKKHGLFVIEDAAHALGAEYKGKKIGNIADLTCFSFYVTKNITTGEGGMVTTSNEELAGKIKVYGLHGMSKDAWKRYSDDGYKHYDVVYPGYKYNMMDIQAAIGIHQMARIEEYAQRREKIWDYYSENLKSLPVTIPSQIETNIKHARHLYTLLIDAKKAGISRDQFMLALHKKGVGSGVHFLPVHLYTYYRQKFGYSVGAYPHAEFIGERTVSIPLSAKLNDSQTEKVVGVIKEILK